MRIKRTFVAIALAMTAALMGPMAVSHATVEPAPDKSDSTVTYVRPMTVTGFDPATAAKYGYPTVRPLNVVPGDCGSSYLFLDGQPHGLKVRTGFDVFTPAAGYSWAVDVYGKSGFRKTWSGVLNSARSWDGTATQGSLATGTYRGIVTSPAWALLRDGTICSAGAPWEEQLVF